ncbi:hypothetical protein VR44_37530 [Streptomyces katrae]|uniref:Uncharacterized protein n=1 Tax=Streptomyces katrae TaxID=68223 RepID=A0A0F4ISM0_9ACTN|nr:hypothetical protein VR44_37530 [Streptomyces katrae]
MPDIRSRMPSPPLTSMEAFAPAPARRMPSALTASAGAPAAGLTRYFPTGKYTVPPPAAAAASSARWTAAVSSAEPSPTAPWALTSNQSGVPAAVVAAAAVAVPDASAVPVSPATAPVSSARRAVFRCSVTLSPL